ncbi:HNH endonuclease [Sulfuriroseicoccus oceanibius]|uniref:HNH endonuclease n=1 Tax=Sulfuriroseicoccus oceanibius TaxID=2707525 RepID=A0A6B3LGP8_9BACT|nr:HNH endonuclease [Sulfuriroseicoccus oceanibius]QQL45888.1 HNH endonuclease [Sulfuriroseicoccus oceanibius]
MRLPKITRRNARQALSEDLAEMPGGLTARLKGCTTDHLRRRKALKQLVNDHRFWEEIEHEPAPYGDSGIWFFKDCEFDITAVEDFDDEDIALTIREAFDRERKAMERLRTKFSGMASESRQREPIPEKVRIFVWQRDGGRCVSCGDNENLEFDHIIPFSKGGSATERNIQLLCRTCNASKGNTI